VRNASTCASHMGRHVWRDPVAGSCRLSLFDAALDPTCQRTVWLTQSCICQRRYTLGLSLPMGRSRYRTHIFIAQPPHLRPLALVTRALWFRAHSPCSAAPSMRFLIIGSRSTHHASFPRSVTLAQLRFTLLTVTNSQRDSHSQVGPMLGADEKAPQSLGGLHEGDSQLSDRSVRVNQLVDL
jgi:hypothetical protein